VGEDTKPDEVVRHLMVVKGQALSTIGSMAVAHCTARKVVVEAGLRYVDKNNRKIEETAAVIVEEEETRDRAR
jgi:regulator of PEP synthase PpsR (kinase-PPPase family)